MRGRAIRLAGGLTDPGSRLPNALALLFVAVLAVVVVHNAFTYPSVSGFEAEADIAYARAVVEHWRIPTSSPTTSPPGFFLLGGGMIKLGEAIGVDKPAHLGQLLNGLLAVGSAILLAVLCAIVFPGRAWLRCAALGFFVSLPVVLKTAAMFHPEPLVAFLALLATVLAARMIAVGQGPARVCVRARDSSGSRAARSLGRHLGARRRLSRTARHSVAHPADRRRALRALVVAGIVGVLVAAPWYVHLQTTFSNPVFGAPLFRRRRIRLRLSCRAVSRRLRHSGSPWPPASCPRSGSGSTPIRNSKRRSSRRGAQASPPPTGRSRTPRCGGTITASGNGGRCSSPSRPRLPGG